MINSIRPGFLEIALFCMIILLLIIGFVCPSYKPSIKLVILIAIYCWGILALFGFFTPIARHSFNIYWGGDPSKNISGIPIIVSLISRGGYISNSPINVKAEVINITPLNGEVIDAKSDFRGKYEEFSIVWFFSRSLKKKAKLLEGQKEAGAISMDIEKCSGKSKIVFTSAGKYGIDLWFRLRNEQLKIEKIKEVNIPQSFIQVSPPETLHQIRNGNITYGLALFVVGFSLFNVLSVIW